MEKTVEERVKTLEKKILKLEGGNPAKKENLYTTKSSIEVTKF